MNKRRALERRHALSPQAARAVKRFEEQRADAVREAHTRHNVAAAALRRGLQRELADIRDRYAKSIDAVKQGDRTGILVTTEVPR